MKLMTGLFVVLLATATIAQEKPAEPQAQTLTPDELTAFDTVKAMEALAQGAIADTKEWKAYAKAAAEYQATLKAAQAKIQSTPEWQAAQGLRQKLDARVKARSAMVINWQTGALTPAPK